MIPVAIINVRRKVTFLKHRFKRVSPLWKSIFLVAGALFLWNLLRSQESSNQTYNDVHITVAQNIKDIKDYCNFPLHPYGDEGSITQDTSGKSRLQLEMAQVLIRHGDRAPALKLPNVDQLGYDYGCSFRNADVHSKHHLKGYEETATYFTQRKMSSQAVTHPLVPPDKSCQYAQLTQKGFLQHFQLGKHFHEVYKELLDLEIFQKEQLYIRSTNRQRTVQSAAALLYGFLTKDIIRKAGGITINITTDTWFRENDDGTLQTCPALQRVQIKHKQTAEYKRAATDMEPLMSRIAQLLGAPRTALPSIVFITDAIYTRSCHGHALPCGPGGCITEEMAAQLIQFSSLAFVNNYSGIAEIISHPLLTQIAQRMIDKSQRRTSLKFSLYSGHDSSITPILLALGIQEGKWLPYATRVVFELWKKQSSKMTGLIMKNYFFRVVLNGKVVTEKVQFCKNTLHYNDNLCPLSELLRWLSGNHGVNEMKQWYLSLCESNNGGVVHEFNQQESAEDRA